MTDPSVASSSAKASRSRVVLLALSIVVIALALLCSIVILPRLGTPMAHVQANRALHDQAIQDIASGTISGGSFKCLIIEVIDVGIDSINLLF